MRDGTDRMSSSPLPGFTDAGLGSSPTTSRTKPARLTFSTNTSIPIELRSHRRPNAGHSFVKPWLALISVAPQYMHRSRSFCRTSKMSHAGTWRASCNNTLLIPWFHVENTFQSTRRDKSRRWLWRLVRPFCICNVSHVKSDATLIALFSLDRHRFW